MRNFIAKHVEEMPPSGIRKFFDVAATMEDVVSLGVGEPDFKTPEHVRQAAIDSLKEGKTRYSSNQGMPELRKVISDYLDRRFHTKYDPADQILCTIGASEAIDIALRTIIEPGDEILVVEPSYVSYKPSITLQGGVPVVLTTKVENEFRLTPEELPNVITDKTKVLILPYPNNPTGAIMEKEDLEKIAKIVIEKDILVMSDEIYAALTYKEKHVSIASLEGMKERTILINGFSKAYAMTGWRLGYACAPDWLIKQMTKIHQFAIMCAPTTSQYAAIEALKNGDEDVETMRKSYNQRRRYLMNTFKEMNLECFEPFGAFYVFPCIKEFGMTSEEFATKFLQEEKVALVPGTAFGDCGEGFLRISYAYSIENLKLAMKRLKNFIERLRNK